MDCTIFLNQFIEKIDNIKEDEFKNNNFIPEEIVVENKITNENLMEFRNYKNNINKKLVKNKQNITEKDNIENENGINILEDDIFQNDEEKQEEFKLNFDEITIDEKHKLINEFIKRKGIDLDEINRLKIQELLNNVEFPLKKFITISKTYQQITKISFLKKLENGSYIVDINEKKTRNKNIFFK